MHGAGHTGHLAHDIGPVSVGRRHDGVACLIGVDGIVRAHGARQLETPRVHVGGDDARRAGRFADPYGERADRTATGDQHHRAGNLGRERGVEGVAHRIVDAADVVADRIVEVPDVGGRHRDELGETAVTIDPDDPGGRVGVRVSGATEEGAFVDDVSLGGDPVADVHGLDETADGDDIPGKFVSDDERRFAATGRPGVPFVDMDIGAADTRATHADEDFVIADRRNGHVRE